MSDNNLVWFVDGKKMRVPAVGSEKQTLSKEQIDAKIKEIVAFHRIHPKGAEFFLKFIL